MRVTNKSLTNNYISNLNKTLTDMSKYQNQLATGKEISRPSDDPFKVVKSIGLNSAVDRNEQCHENIEDSMGWLDTSDTAVRGIVKSLQRVKELSIYGANGTLSDKDLDAIAKEVIQNIEEIVQLGNTNYGGKYVFAGNETTKPPFEMEGSLLINKNGNENNIVREISTNVTMNINITGNDLVGKDGSKLGLDLQKVYNALENKDFDTLSNECIGDIDEDIDRVLSVATEVGAKYNRLDMSKSRNESEYLNLVEMLSNTEDIDFAEKIMQYAMMESIYDASLAVGGKILQPTLLDYIR